MSEHEIVVHQQQASMTFGDKGAFEVAQRQAQALAASDLVPEAYRGNIPNVLLAMETAHRLGTSVLMVMQNMHVIRGRPAWSASFLIASLNASGRFSPLRYEFVGEPHTDSWGCKAWAIDRESGDRLEGTTITIAMVKAEGWWSKRDRNGKETSKWQTLTEQMFRYRAAAFFARAYAPEISMGLHTADEMEDMRTTAGFMAGRQAAAASDEMNKRLGLGGHRETDDEIELATRLVAAARQAGTYEEDHLRWYEDAIRRQDTAIIREIIRDLQREGIDHG